MTGNQQVGRLDAPRTIRIDVAPIPDAGPHDVVIKVARTGICGSDLAMFRYGAPVDGAVLGHEFSGTVVSAGADVAGVATGDRVVANPMVDYLGLGRLPGAFAEYLRLPSADLGRNLFAIPEAISDEAGALIEPLAVALHGVNRSRAKPGEKIVIYGAGPIGLCVLASLRARGIEGTIVVDPSEKRRAIALEMGAAAAHDPAADSAVTFTGEHFGHEALPHLPGPLALADIAFDCAGVTAAVSDAVRSIAPRGRLVIVADPHDVQLTELRLVMMRELEVIGCLAYDDEFIEAIELVASGKVDLKPLVTHRFPLARLDEAFAMQMNAAEAIKVLVVPD